MRLVPGILAAVSDSFRLCEGRTLRGDPPRFPRSRRAAGPHKVGIFGVSSAWNRAARTDEFEVRIGRSAALGSFPSSYIGRSVAVPGVAGLRQLFDSAVIDAVDELLHAYEIPGRISPITPELTQDPCLASVIGFHGHRARGSLVLMTSRMFIAKMLPMEPSEELLRDWIAELGNQALARIRANLSRDGVELPMSLPSVLAGMRLELRHLNEDYCRVYAFTTQNGPILVLIDAVVRSATLEVSSPPESSHEAGELVLF